MPKQPGSSNYTYEEQVRLVDEVGHILPIGITEWRVVKVAFDAALIARSWHRSVESLKRKFNGLWREFERTDGSQRTALVALSWNVKRKMDERLHRQRFGSLTSTLCGTQHLTSTLQDARRDNRSIGMEVTDAQPSDCMMASMDSARYRAATRPTKVSSSDVNTALNFACLESRKHCAQGPRVGQCCCLEHHINEFQDAILRELRRTLQTVRREKMCRGKCMTSHHSSRKDVC